MKEQKTRKEILREEDEKRKEFDLNNRIFKEQWRLIKRRHKEGRDVVVCKGRIYVGDTVEEAKRRAEEAHPKYKHMIIYKQR